MKASFKIVKRLLCLGYTYQKYHHSVRNNENCGRKSSTADTITLHLQVLTFIMKNMKFTRQKVMQKEGGIVKNE